jgi:surface antigen
MKVRTLIAVAALGALAGCSTTGSGAGTSTPSSSGGLLGSLGGGSKGTTSSAIIEAMNGGLIKGSIGANLNESDRVSALEAEYRALEYTPSGEKVAWKGSGNNSGEVTAAQAYRVGSQDCRQYSHTVFAGGPVGTARGTACRNADGSWTPLT